MANKIINDNLLYCKQGTCITTKVPIFLLNNCDITLTLLLKLLIPKVNYFEFYFLKVLSGSISNIIINYLYFTCTRIL